MADDFNDSFDGSSVEEFSSDSYTDFSSEETYEQSSDAFISDYDDTISATDYETTEDDSGLEENDYDDSYNDYVSEEEQEEEYIVENDDFEETVTEPSADPEDAFISDLDEVIQEEDEGLSDEEQSELYLEEDEEEPQEVELQEEESQEEYLADEDDEQIAESEETDPDASEFVADTDNIQPQYGTLAEYLNGHNYGQEDYDVYSQDPEWRRLYSIEYPDAELPPLTSESIDNILAPYEGKTYDSLGEYLSDHNFGQADYEIYSQDPEWRRLYYEQYPDATLPPLSQERIDDILAPYEGKTYDTVEDYLNDHNFGQGDYDIYSRDPEWQRLTGNDAPRILDDFEQGYTAEHPDFKDYYQSGRFYDQGANEYGFNGTCGPTSQANAVNYLLGTNEYTENKVLKIAVENNLCTLTGPSGDQGGTTTQQFMDLYDRVNEQTGGQLNVELHDFDKALSIEEMASKIEEGSVLNVAVDSSALWDKEREFSPFGYNESFYTDHWITVTGVDRDESGEIQGFKIIDSGGGVDYVDVDKYDRMCFGTDQHRVNDPTMIVVSKKG